MFYPLLKFGTISLGYIMLTQIILLTFVQFLTMFIKNEHFNLLNTKGL